MKNIIRRSTISTEIGRTHLGRPAFMTIKLRFSKDGLSGSVSVPDLGEVIASDVGSGKAVVFPPLPKASITHIRLRWLPLKRL